MPAPEVFPVERFREACQRVLTDQSAIALQYGPTEGYRPLRELIVAHMARYGILASVDNVLITSGSQQALDLIAKLLINRGDRILVESPTYLGALQAFDLMGAEYVTVPIDDARACRPATWKRRCAPDRSSCTSCRTSRTLAGSRFRARGAIELVLLSDKYGIPIIEDDPYGQLRYEGEHITPLVVLDRTNLLRDQRLQAGQRDLPEHILEGAGAGTAAGLDRRSAGRHRQAGAAEAEHRPAHQHLHADGGLRSRPAMASSTST